jgi:hypothetical protein
VDLERQVGVRAGADRQARLAGGDQLVVDGLDLGLGVGVGHGRCAAQVAGDAFALDQVGHPGDGRQGGRRVVGGGGDAVGAPDLRVHSGLQGGDLGGVVAGHAGGHAVCFEDHDGEAAALEQQGGGEAGDAAADHRHVEGVLAGQRRAGGFECGQP